MHEGFQLKCKGDDLQQLQTLRLLRHVGHTVYMGWNTGKSYKKVRAELYYPLPFDKKKEEVTKEQITEFFNKKEPVITNGKLRGYVDKNGNLELIN